MDLRRSGVDFDERHGMGIVFIRRLHMLGSMDFKEWERNVYKRKSLKLRKVRKHWNGLVFLNALTELMVGFEKLAYEDFLEAALTLLQSLPFSQSPSLADALK